MSNPRAIAAVTRTLQLLLGKVAMLDDDLSDTTVTTLPLDKARDSGNSANQLNLFLYQVSPNAAWRNQDMPRQVKSGETGMPPLALNLHYLVTPFGKDNDVAKPLSHALIGHAMSVLYDHPVLATAELKTALPNTDVFAQIERLRVTLQPLPVEEIFKLWSGFQTQYRLSAAYEVAVVLIESARRSRTPLPVLTRGEHDSGVRAQGDLTPPYPAVDSIEAPDGQPSAQLGDVITIAGHHLDGDKVDVLFRHPLLTVPIRAPALPGATATQVTVAIDDAPAKWVPGLYGVSVEITSKPGTKNEQVRSTNEASLPLAPTITSPQPIKAVLKTVLNNVEATVKLKCSPQVLPEQRVALLLGEREIIADPRATRTGALSFLVSAASAGEFLIRLRADGVDSLLVDRSPMPDKPPVFKDHRVIIK